MRHQCRHGTRHMRRVGADGEQVAPEAAVHLPVGQHGHELPLAQGVLRRKVWQQGDARACQRNFAQGLAVVGGQAAADVPATVNWAAMYKTLLGELVALSAQGAVVDSSAKLSQCSR